MQGFTFLLFRDFQKNFCWPWNEQLLSISDETRVGGDLREGRVRVRSSGGETFFKVGDHQCMSKNLCKFFFIKRLLQRSTQYYLCCFHFSKIWKIKVGPRPLRPPYPSSLVRSLWEVFKFCRHGSEADKKFKPTPQFRKLRQKFSGYEGFCVSAEEIHQCKST